MDSKTTQAVIGGLIIVGAIIGGFTWLKTSHISPSDARSYGRECTDWISKNYGDGRKSEVFDSWKKRGNIVFEVGVPKEDNPSMASMYLCVVDPSKGTIMKPSAFDQSWNK